MTPLQWFASYVDAVDTAGLLLECQTNAQAERFYTRTLAVYAAGKGKAHTESMVGQVSLLLAGVHAIRGEAA